MRPLDPRLLRHAVAARTFIVSSVLLGITGALLVVVQATLVADLLSRTLTDGAGLRVLRGELTTLGFILAARAVVTWATEVSAYRSAAGVRSVLRRTLLNRAVDFGPQWLAEGRTGELALLATKGLDALDGYFARYLPQLILACVVPIIVGGRIVAGDVTSGIIVLCTLPLIPVFMILIGIGTRASVDRQWFALSRLANHFLDIVWGLPTLRLFGRATAQLGTLRSVSEDLRRKTMRTLRTAFLSSLVLELLASLSVAIIAVSVGFRLVQGDLTLRTALVVLLLAPEVYLPLRRVGTAYHASVEGVTAVQAALDILDAERPTMGGRRMAGAPVPVRGTGLTVRYPGRSIAAIEDLDFVLNTGELVAVVGPSGCGKSTLLAVLLKFRTPDAGSVSVNGIDLADIEPHSWRHMIGWVGQRPHLFAASVDENIRLGRPSATDHQVRVAARQAAAEEFIDALPDGFSTRLGEHGVGLSVGQRQRIAIARAFLCDAPLLLLDEPTASLDAEAEEVVVDSLTSLIANRTVLFTSHRPTLFMRADRIISMPPPAQVAAVEVETA
jgi:thiol reductant ABC exporter CydD subunit